MLSALGFPVFGVYGLCEARWQKAWVQRDATHPNGSGLGPGKGMTDMADIAVVAHSRKSFGGGLPELRRMGW